MDGVLSRRGRGPHPFAFILLFSSFLPDFHKKIRPEQKNGLTKRGKKYIIVVMK